MNWNRFRSTASVEKQKKKSVREIIKGVKSPHIDDLDVVLMQSVKAPWEAIGRLRGSSGATARTVVL